jgi:Fe-S-cluster containining protein
VEQTQKELLIIAVKELANSISSYCQSPCEARCCRVGELLLEKEEAMQFSQKILRDDGAYSVPLRVSGCEHLGINATCNIYASRPELCRSFPLFLKGNSLLVAEWCLAVKAGLLEPGLLAVREEFPEVKIINI